MVVVIAPLGSSCPHSDMAKTDSSIPSPARTGHKSHHYEPRATLRHGASERAHSTSYARGMRQSGMVTVLQPHLGPNARLG